MERPISSALYETAKSYFPGGVNSPVRAFNAVDGPPLFIERGDGAYIWDADGRKFIDYCCSWGPLILGHNPSAVRERVIKTIEKGTSFGAPTMQENELADLILSNHKYLEKIRFVSSGTEATMSAIRLARGVTGRDKVIKFDGCYHGHVDHLLVKAGSGLATLGTSSSAGVPEGFASETIVLPLHDKDAVLAAVKEFKDQIACIIIEPIPANNGLLLQGKEYLQFLRDVCTAEGILLFFDEVISGFRVGFEGAAGYYDIQPDLLAFGKIIGGGLPVGGYGASAEIMGHIAPDGPVYQAGTLSGNPVAMSAGVAQLTACLKPGFYEDLAAKTKVLVDRLNNFATAKEIPFSVYTVGSIFWLAFSADTDINAADKIDPASMDKFKVFHAELLKQGIYIGPSGYEVGFVSDAHTFEDLMFTADCMEKALAVVFGL